MTGTGSLIVTAGGAPGGGNLILSNNANSYSGGTTLANQGIFAPTLRHHDGRFWMITTNWADEGGQLVVHAEDPTGPWSEPVRIPGAIGIDPDLAWDDDGTCLMSYAGFGPGGSAGIVQSAIDPLTGQLLTVAGGNNHSL